MHRCSIHNMDRLKHLVFDELKLVTYASICFELGISPMEAKKSGYFSPSLTAR